MGKWFVVGILRVKKGLSVDVLDFQIEDILAFFLFGNCFGYFTNIGLGQVKNM